MQEVKLYNLIDNFGFKLNNKAQITQVIPSDCKPLGFPIKSFIGKAFENFLTKNCSSKLTTYLKKKQPNKPFVLECEIDCKNKKKVWYRISVIHIKTANGVEFVAHFSNINELKNQLLKTEETVLELKKVNAVNHQVIDSTQAIILVLNPDKTIKSVSKGIENTLGYSSGELVGKDWYKLMYSKSDVDRAVDSYNTFFKSKKTTRVVAVPAICKDGTKKIISWETSKIIADKKIIGILGIGKDITDIENKIIALKESEERFRTLAQFLPTPISCKTIDDKIVFLNKAYTEQFGYTLDDIPDFESWLKVAYRTEAERKDATKSWKENVTILRSGKKVATKVIAIYNKKNERRILKHDATISNNNIYCSYYDITKDAEEEQRIKESEAKFKMLAEFAPVPISFITITGDIVFLNKAYTEQFGYTLNEVPTIKKLFSSSYKTVTEKKVAEKNWKKDVEDLISGKQILPRRITVYNKKGQKRIMEYTATMQENFIYYAYLDITEQIEKEALLLRAKESFERIAENTPIPVGGCHIETLDLTFTNKKFEEIFGYRYTDNVSFKTWYKKIVYENVIDKQNKEKEFDDYVLSIVSNKDFDKKILERKILCVDGIIRTFEIGITYDGGSIYAFFYDVTVRKESEKSLIENEARFRNLAEQMVLPVAFVTRDGKFNFLNKSFTKNFGYDAKEFPDITSVINNSNADAQTKVIAIEYWQSEIEQVFETGKPILRRLEVEIKNGERKLLEYTGTLADDYVYYVYTDITAQKNKEDNLRKSRDEFRSIAENTPVAIAGADIATSKMVFANKLFLEVIGYSIDEINAMNDWGNIIKYDNIDEQQKSLAAWQDVKVELLSNSSSIVKSLERKVQCKDGTIKTFQIGITYDSRSTVYAIFQDITEQREAEKKLLESESRFRNIVEYLPVPLVCLNPVTGVLFSNKKHNELIGYNNTSNKKTNDLSKFSINDLVDEKSRNHFTNLIKKLTTNDKDALNIEPIYTTRIKCRDDEIRTFEITENILGNTLYTIFHDITEQIKATELLVESEQKFKALAENMPIAIGGYDENEKTIFVNKHFTDITGYTIDDVPTLKAWYKQTQPSTKRRAEFYKYWTESVADFRNEITNLKPKIKASSRCKDGSFKHFTYSFSIYNNITYILLIDVTTEEKAKRQLENSYQELRNLTSHLQNIREEERKNISREIHDELGQQLSGIKMDVSAIFKKVKLSKTIAEIEFEQVLDMLNLSVKTVRKISSQLRPSILDDLGLSAAMEWQATDFAKRTGVKCVFNNQLKNENIAPEIQSNLFRILQESLTNIMRHAQAKNVVIDLQNNADVIFVTISDDGKGFNKNLPTSTLGLLGMQERIVMMNGKFEVESSKGSGTKVKISVPIKPMKK